MPDLSSLTSHHADPVAPASDRMTIREMCDAFGVTPRTLRFYEAKDLLHPDRLGSMRLFTRRDRARLTLILRGKRFGFSLENIRQILDLHDPSGASDAQLRHSLALGQDRLAQMQAQRAELDIAIAELAEQLAQGARLLAASAPAHA